MTSRAKNLLLASAVFLVVITLGAVDDWFAASEYGGDGIAYFDIANAIRQGDWNLALNPYWSIGYPLVLVAARWMFPLGWAGEWTSIHVVNMVIFAVTYASFLHFLRVAGALAAKANGAEEPRSSSRLIFVAGSLIFLEWQVQNQNVACTMPDLLISGLYFFLMSAALQFCLRPGAGPALQLGLWAGLGYVTKVVFLPLSFAVFLVVLMRVLTRSGVDRLSVVTKFAWALPIMALFVIPYVIAISVVQGRFTLGESGSLNYAWEVNGLPHWHWLGGPDRLGQPVHPIRLLSTTPHVYEYGEPLHLTYPPFSNPYYWYQGYHHFFSLGNQLRTIKSNLSHFSALFFYTPHAPVKTVASVVFVIAAIVIFTDAKMFLRRFLALWPVYVPSLLGLSMYMIVYMESRYVVACLIILFITPLLALFIPSPLVGRKTAALIVVLIALVTVKNVVTDERPTFDRALRNESYTNNEQWQLGLYLAAQGVPPGAKVAVVRIEYGVAATWAYVSGLHIVAQIGNQNFSDEQQRSDFQLFIGSPQVQQTVFDLFRQAGATVVVVLSSQDAPQGSGWTQVPETHSWVHSL